MSHYNREREADIDRNKSREFYLGKIKLYGDLQKESMGTGIARQHELAVNNYKKLLEALEG